MNTRDIISKQKHSPIAETSVQYLVMPSESKDVSAAGRGTYGFRNRYMAKRSVLRAIRRLRRENV